MSTIDSSEVPKVWIAGPVPPPEGGIATFVAQLARAVPPERARLEVFDTSTHSSVRRTGVWSLANAARAVALCASARRRARAERPDVVQVEAGGYLGVLKSAALAATFKPAAVVLSVHTPILGDDLRSAGPLGRRLIERAAHRAAMIRVIHSGQEADLREAFPDLDPGRVRSIPNFVELPADAADLGSPAGALRVVAVGSVGERKGTFDLLAAARSLLDAGVELECELIGPEEREGELAALRERVAELELSDAVRLAGPVPREQVQERMRRADVFVLPAYREALPMALLEAMALGLPVVTTAAGAIGEVVRQSEIEPIAAGDVGALHDALRRLAEDPGLRRRAGAENRTRIEQSYAPDVVAGRFLELWADVSRDAGR